MRSTMYQKAPFCSPELAQRKLVLYHVGSNYYYYDYQKSFIIRIHVNEV